MAHLDFDSYLFHFPKKWKALTKETLESLRAEALPEGMADVVLAEGNTQILTKPTVAIIGSRRPTLYGRRVATAFAQSLAKQGVCILSGGALGIDIMASHSAHSVGSTCVVVGGGLGCPHPQSHSLIFQEFAHSGRGLVISQFPEHARAQIWHFPVRNRTLAALADFVLVIEATEKSGSLITAFAALEFGVDVGAIPGPLESPLSRGTNRLLADGAFCIQSPNDVLDRISRLVYLRKQKAALCSLY
jgi:DNA processing protein